MTKLIKKHQKLLTSIIKWGIFVLSLLFIYQELFHKRDAVQLFDDYGTRCSENFEFILAVLLLMPLNWFLEAYKWKRLMKPNVEISSVKATFATYAGVAVSILTPNRVGEFAGRMLFINPDKRPTAITMSLAGSISQLMVTLIIGGLFAGIHSYQLGLFEWWYVLIGSVILGGSTFLYFNISKSDKILSRWKDNPNIVNAREALSSLHSSKLLEALLISGIRYTVFSLQLGLLIFGLVDLTPSFDPSALFVIVPIYFLAQTIIPTIALSEIGVRGMILATLFTEIASGSDLLITSTLLWLINIVGPAIMGGISLLNLKFRLYK